MALSLADRCRPRTASRLIGPLCDSALATHSGRMTGKPEVIRLRRNLVLRFYERLAGDSWRDQGLPSLSVFTLPAGTRTMSSAAVSAMATPRVPEVQST